MGQGTDKEASSARRRYGRIDWRVKIDMASEWFERCREVDIVPTAVQMRRHFGWSAPVAYKVKSFISIGADGEGKR